MSTNSNSPFRIGTSLFFLLLTIILIVVSVTRQKISEEQSNRIADKISEKVIEDVAKSLPQKEPTDYPDFDSLQNLRRALLVSNFASWTPGSKLEDDKIRNVILVNKGEISKAYLFIKASQNSRPLTQWESLYIKMNNLGGHIFRPLSLKTPSDNVTQLLYPLNSVPYLSNGPYSEQRVPQTADWFNMLKPGKEVEIITFISSLNPANIDEVSLYYECKQGVDCEVSVR